MITVTQKVHFSIRGSRKRMQRRPEPKREALGRIPRISTVMALAIHFDELIRKRTIADYDTVASLTHVTEPRITQVMSLNNLAPDIQEALLFLPSVENGRDSIHEKLIRRLAAELDWDKQRIAWRKLRRPQWARSDPREESPVRMCKPVLGPTASALASSQSDRGGQTYPLREFRDAR